MQRLCSGVGALNENGASQRREIDGQRDAAERFEINNFVVSHRRQIELGQPLLAGVHDVAVFERVTKIVIARNKSVLDEIELIPDRLRVDGAVDVR